MRLASCMLDIPAHRQDCTCPCQHQYDHRQVLGIWGECLLQPLLLPPLLYYCYDLCKVLILFFVTAPVSNKTIGQNMTSEHSGDRNRVQLKFQHHSSALLNPPSKINIYHGEYCVFLQAQMRHIRLIQCSLLMSLCPGGNVQLYARQNNPVPWLL